MITSNYINGMWQPALDGASYDVTNPADNNYIAHVPDSSSDDARAAVDAAAAALPAWRARSARERAQILKRWHAAIVANADDLSLIISNEQGKPQAEARGEVAYGAS